MVYPPGQARQTQDLIRSAWSSDRLTEALDPAGLRHRAPAAVLGVRLLTRDAARCHTYFLTVDLIAPA